MDSEYRSNFQAWIAQQEADLDELLSALPISPAANFATEERLNELVSKAVRHFVEYSEKRRASLRHDPPAFMCPFWNSTFENSYLWIGGCRPAMFIRLVYAMSGAELNGHLEEFLASGRALDQRFGGSGMISLSPEQLMFMDDVQRRTIGEEEILTRKHAALQVEMGNMQLLNLVSQRNRYRAGGSSSQNGNGTGEAINILDEFSQKLGSLIEEADELRVAAVKELVLDILTPQQAVEFLAAGKQLHLSIHAWGLNRDRARRR